MRTDLLRAALASLLLLLAAGCTHGYGTPKMEGAELSRAVQIDLYVDGSGSMKDLLSDAGTNPFRNLLQNAESELRNPPVQGGWAEETISFHKFGRKITPLTGSGALSHLAETPEAFNESRTPIEQPVLDNPPAKPGGAHIKVIVTDLYQSDHAHETPADALTSRYLSSDTGAIAIAGIRNPYSGPVEDLPGLHGRSLPPGTADTMPFYLLVAGDSAPDVDETMHLLLSATRMGNFPGPAQRFTAWFSKQPAPAPQTTPDCDFRNSPKKTRTGIGVCLAPQPGNPAQLVVRSGTVRVIWPGPDADASLQEALGPSPQLRITALSNGADKVAHEDKVATAAAVACDWPHRVCADINRDKLERGRTWLYRFDLLPTTVPDTFRPESALMRRWNLEDAEVPRIAAGKFPSQSGAIGSHAGRTPGLSQFLLALQGQMFHLRNSTDPPVRTATYFLSVKAR